MIFFLIFGLAFLIIALAFFFKLKRISRNGIKTEGSVFDVEYKQNYRLPYPVIRFLTADNIWITKIPDDWSNDTVPVKGDKVNVIYNPDNPADFIIVSKSNRVRPFILIGLGFIIIWAVLKWLGVHF